MATVFLALPRYDDSTLTTQAMAVQTATEKHRLIASTLKLSLLPYCFNTLWAAALNARREQQITHFAMLHADVVPERGWLDVLVDEMEKTQADVLSCVIPLKDGTGLTSTAVGEPSGSDRYRQPRRLTLHEVHALPETFDTSVIAPGRPLLVNTGCLLCRFDREWAEDVSFGFADRIRQCPDGRFEAQTVPEDWLFSYRCHDWQLRVLATRKVRLSHYGVHAFRNDAPWGSWDRDRQYDLPAGGQGK